MLTLFSVPKAFHGHNGVIQRNAIKSWTLLRPECDIILLGNDSGTAEAADEFGLRHVPDVACNEYGTPRVDSVYQKAADAAEHSLLCHVNADIILMNDFMKAVERVSVNRESFLLAGQRWNVDIDAPLDFETDWEQKLRSRVAKHGGLGARTGLDYLVYSKGLLTDIPQFAIGRTAYDQWFLYWARSENIAVIDATPVVMDVHQNHDYSHLSGVEHGTRAGLERCRNLMLAGGRSHLFTIKDCTEVLTPAGLRRPPGGWRLWRFIRTAAELHPSLPFPAGVLLKALNLGIDTGSSFGVRTKLRGQAGGPWERR